MLSLLALIYGKIVDLRNRLYDRGVFETFDLGARTISIGNITTGGTGKTPLVAYVANILAERGEKVCILTRGYGREDPQNRVLVSDGSQVLASVREAGDEPFELAQKLIGKAIVIADADRVAAAEWAKRRFGVTAFVLDDGFQHRKAKRDLDIVCIDATSPFGSGEMLPAGRLREPLHNLDRADAIVITRSDLVKNVDNLRAQLAAILNPKAKIFAGKSAVTNVVPFLSDDKFNSKTPALPFCGIGNAESFYEGLHLAGINVVDIMEFPDHHIYSQEDVKKIELKALSYHGEVLVTTAKDAVKLSNLTFEIPLYVVEIEMKLDDEGAFAAML